MTKTSNAKKARDKNTADKAPKVFPGFIKHPRTVYLEEGLVRHEDRAKHKRFQNID